MSSSNENIDYTTMNGTINKISYCAFSIVMDGKPKALYLQKYPPTMGTKAPDFTSSSSTNELTRDSISKTDFISFWNSTDSYQPNGLWKGGKWGKNNLMTTDSGWMTGSFIGDRVIVTLVKKGIIKMNGGNGFTSDMPMINGFENNVWSCNIEVNGKIYGVYMTDNIMPQVANDVLFIWRNNQGKKFLKLLTRANNDNVDMPLRMMPGAGEHMEPGKDIKVKDGILRAVYEEIGIAPETLTKCYLLSLGEYSSSGRDPRYWKYNYAGVDFGMERGSITNGYILYFIGDSDKAPKETTPADTQEVNFKWWTDLDSVMSDYPDDRWMIKDHQKFIPDSIKIIDSFESLSRVEQEKNRFNC
jgi:hypothetical protein